MTGELIHNMRRCRLPIVASVKRVAAGAGAVMALASDLRVMGKQAFFAFLFPQVGLSGADMGASWLLAPAGRAGRRVRDPHARRADPRRALRARSGWPTRSSTTTIPRRSTRGVRARQAHRRGPALRGAHDQADDRRRSSSCRCPAAIEAEAQAQAICMQHPDFREAHEAWKAGPQAGLGVTMGWLATRVLERGLGIFAGDVGELRRARGSARGVHRGARDARRSTSATRSRRRAAYVARLGAAGLLAPRGARALAAARRSAAHRRAVPGAPVARAPKRRARQRVRDAGPGRQPDHGRRQRRAARTRAAGGRRGRERCCAFALTEPERRLRRRRR